MGEPKYFPAASKEWKNKVYFFNYTSIKNFPVYTANVDKIIRNYFNLYFLNVFLFKEFIIHKLKRLSLNKIYVSKPELKHTNHKVTVTIYVYNKEILSLSSIIHKLIRKFHGILLRIKKEYLPVLSKSEFIEDFYRKFSFKKLSLLKLTRKNRMFKLRQQQMINEYRKNELALREISLKELVIILKPYLYELFIFFRKYKLYFQLNKFKFKEIFLYKLGKIISKFFNKKIEFNIINLHSIAFHPDLFTEFLKLKLKRRKRISVIRAMNFILNRVDFSKSNNIKGNLIKNVDFNLLENKYNNLNVNSLINKNSLSERLMELYSNVLLKPSKKLIQYRKRKNTLKKEIFNSIKYKNLRGIRLEIKGRLTWRYRADRAVYKVLWKGGLKNIDSSFKGLSAVSFRGFINSNVEYSIRTSRRRIGAFAVKGWISGK